MANSHTHHQQILNQIKALSDKSATEIKNMENYLGTEHLHYGLKAAARKKIVTNFKKQQQINFDEFIALLNQLYHGKSYEERAVAGEFLQRYSTFSKKLSLAELDKWLRQLVGWAEIDGTCQSNFTAQELLGNWLKWQKFLTRLNQDKNINKKKLPAIAYRETKKKIETGRK